MSISIFAKQTTLNRRGYLHRVSSMIRGVQVAEQIGAKLNPSGDYENDVCIYVKPHVPKGHDFNFEGKKNYLDIIDGHNLGQLLLKRPEIIGIVCSDVDYEIMTNIYNEKGETIKNKIVLIPQHHCNFGRVKRTGDRITTVGAIGTPTAFDFFPKDLKKELKKRNIKLFEFSGFRTRQEIIDFYMKIDVQIVWRPYKKILSNPLKLVNAASFGIPTIALDEPAFKELAQYYFPVNNLTEFLTCLDELRADPKLYASYSNACLGKAEDYHIEKIGELYKELDK